LNTFEIHQQFENSPYGKTLFRNVRYTKYKPDSISKTQWNKLLGADGNNLLHLRVLYGLSKALLPHNPDLNNRDKNLLIKLAIVHDWGEAIVGDVPPELKTKAHENAEKIALKDLLDKFNVSESQKLLNILFDPENRLHEFFKTIESAGYLRTAIIAWQSSNNSEPHIREALIKLIEETIEKILIDALSMASEHPHLIYFFEQIKTQLDEIFSSDIENFTSPAIIKAKTEWEFFKYNYLGELPEFSSEITELKNEIQTDIQRIIPLPSEKKFFKLLDSLYQFLETTKITEENKESILNEYHQIILELTKELLLILNTPHINSNNLLHILKSYFFALQTIYSKTEPDIKKQNLPSKEEIESKLIILISNPSTVNYQEIVQYLSTFID
jgi:5'-deoxynucleotidase YfbR-like HD superfamily hydrolase